MIIFGILGDIGSGKSYVAKQFGLPVFNADDEVTKIYRNSKVCFTRLKRLLPKYIKSFPIRKIELANAVLENKRNLKIISKIVHPLVRKKMNLFLFKNKKRKAVVLDIPLLLENKIKKRNMVLVFVNSKRSKILKRLNKRKGFNQKVFQKLKKMQLPLDYKKRKSRYVINNNDKKSSARKRVKDILNMINL